MKTIALKQRSIGPGLPVYVIAEVAQAHEGSLGMAHAYIDAVAKTGADAVKFQTHIAEEESTPQEPWRINFSYEDDSRFDYWKRMEFDLEQWLGLKKHAKDVGLEFLSSPFSTKAVEWLIRCEVPAWKIASGEINNFILYEAIARTGLPVLLSSGMSREEETDTSVRFFREWGIDVAVMQCTTAYPCPPELVGLKQLARYAARYDCPVGLSDHSGNTAASLAAVALAASLIEVHVTLSREMFGPDTPASLTTKELTGLCDGVRRIERMLGADYDKNALAAQDQDLAAMFGKALVAVQDLKAGETVTLASLTSKKPRLGIPASALYEVLGKRVRRDVVRGAFLQREDLA